MAALRPILDRKRSGTQYTDRMHRILGVCHDCGLLWHDEKVTYRNGVTEIKRVDDVEPLGQVVVTPKYEKYGLRVNPSLLPKIKTMGSQFAYALNVPQEGTRVEIDGNVVYVRIPITDGKTQLVTFNDAWKIEQPIPVGSLLLGVDENQHQMTIDMENVVHVACVGTTGSGKSSLMKTMILSALKIRGARVALFDPTGGFEPLSGHPYIWRGGLFRTPDECELGLEALAATIGQKQDGLLYVFIDELPDLIMRRPRIREHVSRLAQAGRHAGIHLVIGAQQLLSSEVGAATLRNIPARLIGRVVDKTAAYGAAGRGDVGAESLRGSGDMIGVNGSTQRRFQAAIVPDKMLTEWAGHYPPRTPRVPVRASCWRPDAVPVVPLADPAEVGASLAAGGGGRMVEDIPECIILAIQAYYQTNEVPPALNEIDRMAERLLPGQKTMNRERARRARELALDALGVPREEYHA